MNSPKEAVYLEPLLPALDSIGAHLSTLLLFRQGFAGDDGTALPPLLPHCYFIWQTDCPLLMFYP